MPGLIVLRPADANEVVEAWRVIMQLRHEPVALILTRQALPTFGDRYAPRRRSSKGGYVLADAPGGTPEVLLLGDRQRSLAVHPGLRAAEGGGRRGARRQHAVAGSSSSTSRKTTATRCCRRP